MIRMIPNGISTLVCSLGCVSSQRLDHDTVWCPFWRTAEWKILHGHRLSRSFQLQEVFVFRMAYCRCVWTWEIKPKHLVFLVKLMINHGARDHATVLQNGKVPIYQSTTYCLTIYLYTSSSKKSGGWINKKPPCLAALETKQKDHMVLRLSPESEGSQPICRSKSLQALTKRTP